MRKLVKYLKDYEDYKSKKFGRGNYIRTLDKKTGVITAIRFPDRAYICEDESRAIIICRGYNFIKWLFDEDKIDWSKFHKYSFYKKNNKFIQYYDCESLLMALSISDTPIEDLISYLK